MASRRHEPTLGSAIAFIRGTPAKMGITRAPTAVKTRGRRANGPELATDPNAGWYVREGDHRDPDAVSTAMRPDPPAKKGKARSPERAKKTSLKKKYLYGYDVHLIVTRDAEHEGVLLDDGTPSPEILPALVLGVALDKPGHRPAYNGLKILNRMPERGYKPGYLAGDRGYNNSEPDEWQLPIRALGYKPVYDYRSDQLGKQAQTHSAILVEGRWYCPSMPEPLFKATIDLHSERIDRETWIKPVAARRSYRIMPKENPDTDGYQRMMCPAQAGKAQCPIKPHTLGRDIRLPLVDPEPSPAGPPECAASARSPSARKPAPNTGSPSTTAGTPTKCPDHRPAGPHSAMPTVTGTAEGTPKPDGTAAIRAMPIHRNLACHIRRSTAPRPGR
ncbi:hypothetical protein ACWGQ5_55205 [Streptomyces sp. NPDC055722]